MKLHSPADPMSVRDGGTPTEEQRIEAIVKERLSAAVREATEPLRARIDHLSSNRDSLIREKRQLEGRAVKDAQQRVEERPKAIDFAITRSQARDPQEYRRARDEAAKHGLPLMILDDAQIERKGEPPATFQSDTHYFVYAPTIKGDAKAYQQHKAEAERQGLRFHVAYTADEMPKEAFSSGDAE